MAREIEILDVTSAALMWLYAPLMVRNRDDAEFLLGMALESLNEFSGTGPGAASSWSQSRAASENHGANFPAGEFA